MKVIGYLDRCLADPSGFELADSDVRELMADPSGSAHRLLLQFKERNIDFPYVEPPQGFSDAVDGISTAQRDGERFVYALHLLRLKNPVLSVFADEVLGRL
jgi:hypothetical protein